MITFHTECTLLVTTKRIQQTRYIDVGPTYIRCRPNTILTLGRCIMFSEHVHPCTAAIAAFNIETTFAQRSGVPGMLFCNHNTTCRHWSWTSHCESTNDRKNMKIYHMRVQAPISFSSYNNPAYRGMGRLNPPRTIKSQLITGDHTDWKNCQAQASGLCRHNVGSIAVWRLRRQAVIEPTLCRTIPPNKTVSGQR